MRVFDPCKKRRTVEVGPTKEENPTVEVGPTKEENPTVEVGPCFSCAVRHS